MNGKIVLKGNWATHWGITSMDVEPDCEILSEVGWVYIHRYGETVPCCKLRKKWIRSAYYYKDGELITVLPQTNVAQNGEEND